MLAAQVIVALSLLAHAQLARSRMLTITSDAHNPVTLDTHTLGQIPDTKSLIVATTLSTYQGYLNGKNIHHNFVHVLRNLLLQATIAVEFQKVDNFDKLIAIPSKECEVWCFIFEDTIVGVDIHRICARCPGSFLYYEARECLLTQNLRQTGIRLKYVSPALFCPVADEGSGYNDASDTEDDITCISFLKMGSINQRPVEGVCQVEGSRNASLYEMSARCGFLQQDSRLHLDVQRTSSGHACQRHGSIGAQMKVTWLCAKINYALIGVNIMVTTCMWLLLKNKKRRRQGRCYRLFACCNVLWLAWCTQETLNTDNQWRDDLPYSCVFTGSLGYISYSMALYLMTASSVLRQRAIMSTMKVSPGNSARYRWLALAFGAAIGTLCSLLNISALVTMPEAQVARRCQVQGVDSMEFLLVAKITSVVFVHLVPCFTLMATNAISVFALKRLPQNSNGSSMKRRGKAVKNLQFILLCSLLVVCYLPKPLFDLQRAIEMLCGAPSRVSYNQAVAEGVLGNLTVIAILLNTLTGMKFSG
jgi:hypothetical protein